MRTPLRAMLWEAWRTSRFELLLRVVAMSSLVILVSIACQNADGPTTQLFSGLLMLLLAIASIFFPTWLTTLESQHGGFSFRLGFVRPVSTFHLVAVPLFYAIAVAVTCYAMQVFLLHLLTGISLPLAIPALLITCSITWLLTALWSPTSIAARGVAICALIIGIIPLFLIHNVRRNDPEPLLLAIGKPDYLTLSLVEYIVLGVLTSIAFVTTLICVDRQRHGDPLRIGPKWRIQYPIREPVRKWKAPFRSKKSAQFWFEMHLLGHSLLTVAIMTPLIVLTLVTAIGWFVPDWQGSALFWIAGLLFGPLLYQLIGVDGSLGLTMNQGSVEYSSFDGTRPLRNDQMIAMKLLAIVAASLLGWLWMAATALTHTILANEWDVWQITIATLTRSIGDVSAIWWLAGGTSAVLLYLSSSSMLIAFGLLHVLKPRLFFAVGLLTVAHIILALWDAQRDWSLQQYWVVLGYVMSVAIVAMCLLGLRRAFEANLLGGRLFVLAFGLWVVYVASVTTVLWKANPAIALPTQAYVIAASTLLIPLASIAIAPLALASHRHA